MGKGSGKMYEEGMAGGQYASWLRLVSLNLTMIEDIDDPREFAKALSELAECLRAGLEGDVPEDLEEMTREEMQRFANLLAAEGKTELEAYRSLMKVIRIASIRAGRMISGGGFDLAGGGCRGRV